MSYPGGVIPYATKSHAAPIDFGAIREQLDLPGDFPREIIAEAQATADQWLDVGERADDRDLPFVTIDPATSTDLDQAVHIAATDGGYRVHYAIVDLAAFITPGGALDEESWRRGLTFYSPDTRTPLYPTILSEGAASLLPDHDRPAVLWTIDLDERGEITHIDLRRSLVQSRAKLNYHGVQADTDRGSLHPAIEFLPRVGRLRQQVARRRHAINLDLPSAEIEQDSDNHWTLRRRSILPVESYNAEISLLTGMAAAQLMLQAKIGILRTLPTPTPDQVAELRRVTAALDLPWPADMPVGDMVSQLDSARPRQAAFIEDAIRLLRGAGYTYFDGELPTHREHGGLGAPYAHVTAPMRRLVDRFATEVCLAITHDAPTPAWVRQALPELPAALGAATDKARRLERACAQAVTEFLLADRVGEIFTGIVVQRSEKRVTVLLDAPPIRVTIAPDGFTEGARAAVRLTAIDKKNHRVEMELVT